MTQQTELLVQRGDLRATKIAQGTLPAPGDGEVQVAIDKFGLTANNVTYAMAGDMIGYWQFYPAEDNWGKVPVWGFGNVIASNCDQVPVGERLWGFFPMASHALLRPGRVKKERFTDVSEHREDLPAVYNNYSRSSGRTRSHASVRDRTLPAVPAVRNFILALRLPHLQRLFRCQPSLDRISLIEDRIRHGADASGSHRLQRSIGWINLIRQS